MNGQDKGLVLYRDRPLADWVLQSLAAQTSGLMISANRHLLQYQALLRAHTDTISVWPDDADLPPASGPLAGIITALRHCPTDWLLIAPCDVPHLPADLVERLWAQAAQTQADVVVPCTSSDDDGAPQQRMHWVCALIHKRVCPQTEALFVKGERKAGHWVRSCNWSSVSFADNEAFTNMNTLETLHGRA